MPGSLDTTNTMLAIIAAVSVLQGLVLLGLGFAGWTFYRHASMFLTKRLGTSEREVSNGVRIRPV